MASAGDSRSWAYERGVIVQILTVLSAIGRVEASVGEFYNWLSEVYAVPNVCVSGS